MKKSRYALVLLSIVTVVCLAACVKGEDMKHDTDGTDTGYKTTADFYCSFDEEGVVKETVSGRQYDVSYVFSEAKYTSPKAVPRAAGVRGNSMLFDGYSTFADTAVFFCGNKLSVSVWVAPRAFDTRSDKKLTGIVSCLDDNGGFEFGVYNYGSWCFRVRTNKGTFQIWDGDNALDLYQWNYLTAVFDGSARKMYLYKNGVRVSESNVLGDTILQPSVPLRVGCIVDPAVKNDVFTQNIFSGLMDELEIYSSALTAKEIDAKYRALSGTASLDVYKDLWLRYDVLADDRYAPQYHLRVSQNWQNETYGFFRYKGLYHAFCQQNVLGPYYSDGQRWGHFVSVDLVHWEELVPALLPEDNGIDPSSVFSGCATLDKEGKPVIFYTGVDYANETHMDMISSARPADEEDMRLERWTKSGKTEVAQGSVSNRYNFRDPFVYVENGEYFMLVGATDNQTGNGAVYCYKAKDDALSEWQYVGLTYSGDRSKYGYLGDCYELPNLFRLTNADKTASKYMLMFSPINGTNNGVYYLLGQFDTATGVFTPEREEPYRYDVGPLSQVLCPSGFYDAYTDRNLLITMSRTGMNAQQRYDSGWGTAMTLIKEITLGSDGLPRFAPIAEYASLEEDVLVNLQGEYDVGFANTALSAVHGDMLKIELEVQADADAKVGLYVKYDSGGVERVDIYYDGSRKVLYIDPTKSSTDMRHNGAGGGKAEVTEGTLKFTVYVDRAMVEAYLNDVNQVTAFGYNASPNADGILLYSDKSNTKIVKLKVCSLSAMTNESTDAYWE